MFHPAFLFWVRGNNWCCFKCVKWGNDETVIFRSDIRMRFDSLTLMISSTLEFLDHFFWVWLGLSPGPVTVTTRIVIFFVGDPELNLHLPLLLEPKVWLYKMLEFRGRFRGLRAFFFSDVATKKHRWFVHELICCAFRGKLYRVTIGSFHFYYIAFVCLRWFFTFYHGKSPSHHHSDHICLYFFQASNKQIQDRSRLFFGLGDLLSAGDWHKMGSGSSCKWGLNPFLWTGLINGYLGWKKP